MSYAMFLTIANQTVNGKEAPQHSELTITDQIIVINTRGDRGRSTARAKILFLGSPRCATPKNFKKSLQLFVPQLHYPRR
jgi:hypothetical protein